MTHRQTLSPRNCPSRLRSRTALGTLATAVTVAVGAGTVGPALAATPPPAADLTVARLIDLRVSEVDAFNLSAYHGVYGKADTPAPNSEDSGDFADPDHVLDYVDVLGSAVTRTARADHKNYAQTHLAGLTVKLAHAEFIKVDRGSGSLGSLDTYAECVPPPSARTPWRTRAPTARSSRCSAT